MLTNVDSNVDAYYKQMLEHYRTQLSRPLNITPGLAPTVVSSVTERVKNIMESVRMKRHRYVLPSPTV